MRKMWRSAQKFWQNLAEFNTVHILRRENASRFFSGASVKICHIPVKFFMTIAKIFHNPSKVSYVDLSSNLEGFGRPKRLRRPEVPDQCVQAPARTG